MTSPILTSSELAELDRLRRHLALHVASDGQGSHRSSRRGQSAEFVDHRGYAPGDDLRRLDWNVLARSDMTVIKRFRAEEEGIVRVVLDCTGSMRVGEPSKFELAKKLAASVLYLALANGERAQLLTLTAEQIKVSPPRRGRGQYGSFDRQLSLLEPDQEVRVAAEVLSAFRDVLQRMKRSSLLAIVTDALAPDANLDAWPKAIALARANGHETRFIQVLAHEDIDPPWTGDLSIIDEETGGLVEVTFDDRARLAFAQLLERCVHELREACRKNRASYVRALCSDQAIAIMRKLTAGHFD